LLVAGGESLVEALEVAQAGAAADRLGLLLG
jgi:hypothetical protein